MSAAVPESEVPMAKEGVSAAVPVSEAPVAKAEVKEAEVSEALLAQIKKQMEYYFSNDNFRTDKYLRAKVAEDADGFVPLEVFMNFNKLKKMTTDLTLLPRALEDSEDLELSEDKGAVRRTRPLPEENDADSRSMYAKGPFPSDATLEDLRAWAGQAGEVSRLNMRRMSGKDKAFKGSVFIVYAKVEACAALGELFAKGELKYQGGAVLKVEPLKEYAARKKKERDERRAKKAAAGGEGGAKKAGGAAAAGAGGSAAAGGAAAPAAKRPPRDAADKVEEDEEEAGITVQGKDGPRKFIKELIPGTILKITDLGALDLNTGKLQTFFNHITGGGLKFVEYNSETKIAFARFANAGESWAPHTRTTYSTPTAPFRAGRGSFSLSHIHCAHYTLLPPFPFFPLSLSDGATAVLAELKTGGPNVKEATGSDAPVGHILEGAC